MKCPDWLQEMRDLLAIRDYDGRQAALMEWEARWLIDLHCRELITDEEEIVSRFNMLEHVALHVRQELGMALSDLMAVVTISKRPHMWDGLTHVMEVRGDVLAIRREPKADVPGV
jgi:hypothetical protein